MTASKPLGKQGGTNTSSGSGSRLPRPSPSASQPRPHTSGSGSAAPEHFRSWGWTSGRRMVRRYVGAVRACRATGPLAQGLRAQAAAGSYFLGHYATALSLRKAWGPLPAGDITSGAGQAGEGGGRARAPLGGGEVSRRVRFVFTTFWSSG